MLKKLFLSQYTDFYSQKSLNSISETHPVESNLYFINRLQTRRALLVQWLVLRFVAATTPVRIRDSAFILSSYGLVGYDDRLTRGRSPVRFRVAVLFRCRIAIDFFQNNLRRRVKKNFINKKQVQKFQKTKMTGVGFEPTPPKRLVPKTSALDHSANQSITLAQFYMFLIFKNSNNNISSC